MAKRDGEKPQPAVRRLARYLEAQITELERSLPKVIKRGKPKPVHKARVAARRLSAALDLLEPIAKRKPLKRLRKAAKRIRKSLGPLRDVDAMTETLDRLRPVGRVRERIDSSLADARDKAFRAAKKRASRHHTQIDRDDLAALLADCTAAAIQACIREAAYAGVDAIAEVLAARPGEEAKLHPARIASKRLRYALEIGVAIGLPIATAVVERVTTIQSHLGAWHDAVVLAGYLADSAADRKQGHAAAAAAREHFGDRVRRSATIAERRARAQWHSTGGALSRGIRKALPLA